MKLTKEQAIEKTEEMWAELAETGSEDKEDTRVAKSYEGFLICDCFLCEYVGETIRGHIRCLQCPYYQRFHGKCWTQNRPYIKWDDAGDPETRKEYAKLFLEQVRQLKEEK